MDPITGAILGLAPSIIGQKQLGQSAPSFMPGQTQGLFGNGLISQAQKILPTNVPLNVLGSLINSSQTDSQASPQQAQEEVGPPISDKERQAAMESSKPPGFSDKFFGSIGGNINDPAKLLIMGLLNDIGPMRYGTLGLLGKGLFDATRNRNGSQ